MTRNSARSMLLAPALIGASCLLLPSLADAQFQALQIPGAYTPLVNPTIVSPTTGSFDDDEYTVTIPFAYSHLGSAAVTEATLSTNGAIMFPGNLQVPFSNPVPGPGTPNFYIGMLWDDLQLTASPTNFIATQTQGMAPNRVFIMEFSNLNPLGNPATLYNAQVHLFESGTTVFEVHYGPTVGVDSFENFTLAAENSDGTIVVPFTTPPCGNSCTNATIAGLNNMIIRIQPPPEPQLEGSLATFPAGGLPGTPLSGDVTILNRGLNDAASVTTSLYYSVDNVLDMTDTLIGSATAPAPSGNSLVTISGTVPLAAVPNAFLILVVDEPNAWPELDETNNISASAFIGAFELRAANVVVDRVLSGPGGITLDVTMSIANDGATYTGPVQVELLATTDMVLDAADSAIDTFTANIAGSPRVETITRTVTLPQLPPATYFLAMRIDGNAVIVEADETNNELVGADQFANSNDFFVSNVASNPSTGQIGEMITVNARVQQRGVQFTGNVPFGIYMSQDDTYDPADQAVYKGLAFYPAENFADLAVTFPLSSLPGEPQFAIANYTVFAVIDPDNTIPEADEANNSAAGGTFQINGPNLFPPFISADPVVFIGGDLTIRATIDNESPTFSAVDWNYSYHLSDNDVCRVTDPRIFVSPDITLGAGESLSVTNVVPLPSSITSTQTAFVCIIADIFSEVAETNESDNLRTFPPVNLGGIRILQPVADFTTQVVATGTAAAGGEEISVSRVVANEGPLGETGVPFAYYLSSNPTITTDDIEIGRFTVDLPPGADVFGIDTMTVPAAVAEGNYYIGIIVDPDGDFEEVSTDNNSSTGPQIFVYGAAIQFITNALPQAVVGVDYSAGLFARGGAQPITWSVESGTLPTGIVLDSQSGILSGPPSEEGLFEFVLRASSGGAFSVRPFAIRVVSPTVGLQVATGSLPPGFTGRPYATELVAVGGTLPYTWTAVSALPSGLRLAPSGLLSGTPNGAGQLTINVQVQDSLGETASRSVRLTIANPDLVVQIRQSPLPDAQVGLDYCEASRVSFQAEGGATPYSWTILSGNVPGLTLDAASGEYCGVPEQVGQYDIVLRVQDDAQLFDTSLFTLNVVGGSQLAVSVFSLPDVNLNATYMETLTAINGTEPYTWSVAGGDLPTGLSLSEGGVISGTASEAGTYAFRVEVRDSQGRVNDQPLSITVIGDEVTGPGSDDGCSCEAADQTSGSGASSVLLALAFGGLMMLRRKSRKGAAMLFAATIILGASGLAEAQPVPGTPYFRQQTPVMYTGCEGSPQQLGSGTAFNEYPVTFPFAFKFYDTESAMWTISDFPVIAIGTPSFISCNIPPGSTSTPVGFIAPFWECEIADSVSVSVVGVAPQRKVCVEWSGFRDRFSTPTPRINIKLEMFEGPSGRIDMTYSNITGTGTPFTTTMGMEDNNAGRPILFHPSNCTTNCTWGNVTDFAGQRITYLQDPGVELQALSLEAPDFAFVDTPVTLQALVQNLHRNPVGPAVVEVQASATQNFANPTTIGSTSVSFAGFELKTVSISTTLPASLGAGRYYYRAVVDPANLIAEAVEGNNAVPAPNFTRVIETAAELQAVSVSVSSQAVNAGGTVDVSYVVRNNGGAVATNAGIDIMLSTNPVISPQDSSLGSTQVTLQPGQTEIGMLTVSIPSEVNSGDYYLGVFADVAGAIGELNESNNGLAIDTPITVTGGTLGISTRNLPQALLGKTYTALAVATGGDGSYLWEVASGTLPMGLGIVPESGQFFGRAGMVETQTFTLQVSSAGQMASTQLTLIVSDPSEPLTVVNRSVPDGVVGQEYDFALVATGGSSTSSLAWTATGLPEGLALSTDGLLGGTPTTTATTTFSVSASAGGETASRALRIIIRANPNLLIQPKILSTARFGEVYNEQLTAEGGVSPIFWSLSDPTQLPDGVDLGSDGALTGTPNEVGRFRFQVEAFDSAGGQSVARDTETFVLKVEDVAGTFVISTEALEVAYVAEGYEAAIAAQGGSRPYDWSIGRVPEGLGSRVNPSTNELELFGAPTAAGTTNLLVEVTDSQGRATQKAFAIRVLATRPVIGPNPNDDTGCTCVTPDAPNFGWILLGMFGLFGLRRRRR